MDLKEIVGKEVMESNQIVKNKIKVLSLFDGISVARQALTELGYEIEYYASEIDKYAVSVALHNFPDTKQVGDVKLLKGEDFKGIDLIIGGSPCQDLSIAKQGREGLKGSRSGLFYEFARLVKEIKPKYFVLENVNSMPREAREEITKVMGVEPIMINASLVSAQNRKRLFWTNISNITQPEDRGILLKDILEPSVEEKFYIKNFRKNTLVTNRPNDVSNPKGNTLLVGGTNPTIRLDKEKGTRQLVFLGGIRNKDWARDGKSLSRNYGQGDRVYSPEGKSTTLSANGGGRGAKTGLYEVKAVTMVGDFGKRKVSTSDKAYCLAANPSSDQQPKVQENNTIRKLTPIECERLQSLPDDYTKEPNISNTQRYKMLGNAFNKDVVKHILGFMKD